MQKRVLLVEDEPEIRHLVETHLSDCGCEVTAVGTCRHGETLVASDSWDLLILDLMLPDGDGMDICRLVRQNPGYLPVMMLTARSTEDDRVLGLDTGADDYLAKPFSVLELKARVRAILRRSDAYAHATEATVSTEPDQLALAGLLIDVTRRSVALDDVPIQLTAKEFDLLLHFARHPGRVFTRTELLDQVWGYSHEGYEHTVNSHINRLRAKIEKQPTEPRFVKTVWGVGYRFFDPSVDDAAAPAQAVS